VRSAAAPRIRVTRAGPERIDDLVGCALVHVASGETMLATGERVASLETLSILPPVRGQGIGGVGRVSAGA